MELSQKVEAALEFCKKAHGDQIRKYTGAPYWTHPYEVMMLVKEVGGTEDMLCAALLHDVVEDTDVKLEEIQDLFGPSVAELVYWLTDVSKPNDGNRAKRKAMDREHIARAPAEAKTIKLADLISNSKSIAKYDPDFAKVYMNEKTLVLKDLFEGNGNLFQQAVKILDDYFDIVR